MIKWIRLLLVVGLFAFAPVNTVLASTHGGEEEDEEKPQSEAAKRAAEAPTQKGFTDEQRREFRMQMYLNNIGSANNVMFEKAINGLEDMGKEGIHRLIELLREEEGEREMEIHIIYALGRMRRLGVYALPTLKRYINHDDAEIRAVTANALGRIGKPASELVPQLAGLLLDDDDWVKNSAHRALESIRTRESRKALEDYKKAQQFTTEIKAIKR